MGSTFEEKYMQSGSDWGRGANIAGTPTAPSPDYEPRQMGQPWLSAGAPGLNYGSGADAGNVVLGANVNATNNINMTGLQQGLAQLKQSIDRYKLPARNAVSEPWKWNEDKGMGANLASFGKNNPLAAIQAVTSFGDMAQKLWMAPKRMEYLKKMGQAIDTDRENILWKKAMTEGTVKRQEDAENYFRTNSQGMAALPSAIPV